MVHITLPSGVGRGLINEVLFATCLSNVLFWRKAVLLHNVPLCPGVWMITGDKRLRWNGISSSLCVCLCLSGGGGGGECQWYSMLRPGKASVACASLVRICLMFYASVNSSSAHPPPGNSGVFSRTFHPGCRALAFHPIIPGHLTIPHSFTLQHCRFF